jgi:hypothetical protein
MMSPLTRLPMMPKRAAPRGAAATKRPNSSYSRNTSNGTHFLLKKQESTTLQGRARASAPSLGSGQALRLFHRWGWWPRRKQGNPIFPCPRPKHRSSNLLAAPPQAWRLTFAGAFIRFEGTMIQTAKDEIIQQLDKLATRHCAFNHFGLSTFDCQLTTCCGLQPGMGTSTTLDFQLSTVY